MSRKTQSALGSFAGQPLSMEELEQIQGGFEATLLRAMGWKSITSNCLNGDGSSGRSTVWVKGDIVVGTGKCM